MSALDGRHRAVGRPYHDTVMHRPSLAIGRLRIPAAVGSSLGVATLLIASGAAFSIRELFRDRGRQQAAAPTASVDHE